MGPRLHPILPGVGRAGLLSGGGRSSRLWPEQDKEEASVNPWRLLDNIGAPVGLRARVR